MKKVLLMAGVVFAAAGVKADVGFTDVVARQLWPFKSTVAVDCMVSGVTTSTPIRISVRDGETTLCDVPDIAIQKGGTVASAGKHHLEFDPALVPELSSCGVIRNFNVTLAAASPEHVLYVIFDLTKNAYESGQLQDVTESALRAGTWGAWEVDATSGSPIWKGVAADPQYAQTKLVFRYIPAGTFLMNNNRCVGQVTLSRDYFISVFYVTASQYARLKGESISPEDTKPNRWVSYNMLRGSGWPSETAVAANSDCAVFSAKLGTFDFDIPTSAQWEYAVRAGADGKDQNNNDRLGFIGYTDENLPDYVWYQGNTGWQMQPVGTRRPNPWGIYDPFGDVWHMCRDWAGPSGAGTDPVGPNSGEQRLVRGGCVTSTNKGECNAIFAWGAVNPDETSKDIYGFRLVFHAH